MKILEMGLCNEFILRDDLEAEDLIVLLDILQGCRSALDGTPANVMVGEKQPRPVPKEEPIQ